MDVKAELASLTPEQKLGLSNLIGQGYPIDRALLKAREIGSSERPSDFTSLRAITTGLAAMEAKRKAWMQKHIDLLDSAGDPQDG